MGGILVQQSGCLLPAGGFAIDTNCSLYYFLFLSAKTESIKIDGHKLKEHVTSSLLPFLRCCAVFFHFLTGIKLPDALKNGESNENEGF